MIVGDTFGGRAKMSEGQKSTVRTFVGAFAVGVSLLAGPGLYGVTAFRPPSPEHFAQSQQDAAQSARDREQQKRDQEQAARDREQEKKDAEQARLDHLQELYDEGRGFLDEGDYGDAGKKFGELAKLAGPQADAALYWKAYADNKMGKREAALEGIADLKKRFPQSRWKKDAEALEIEMRQNSGQSVNQDGNSANRPR